MLTPIITVENLSKLYRIGAKEQGYKTFRESIIDGLTAPIRNFRRLRKLTKFNDVKSNPLHSAPCPVPSSSEDTIWALNDVSFEVKPGELVGIIGRNGAGKSTLLKILSRITEPTSGDVKIHGKVSSLLEVGTGFHPELTGRENIFLNGAILGMKMREIREKFDEIVAFAEIEKFIDTPVKRYSSGMYVRLAFSVAAHLEPDILLVDEVLAVGDYAFQKKCLGKMGKVAKEGRTVLFVSHNTSAISRLCERCIVLGKGQIIFDGSSQEAINYYLKPSQVQSNIGTVSFKSDDSFPAQILRLSTHNIEGDISNTFFYEDGFEIGVIVKINKQSKSFYTHFRIYNVRGEGIFFSSDDDLEESFIANSQQGAYQYRIKIPGKILKPDKYSISIAIAPKIDNDHEFALWFEIVDVSSRRASRSGGYRDFIIAPELKWEAETIENL